MSNNLSLVVPVITEKTLVIEAFNRFLVAPSPVTRKPRTRRTRIKYRSKLKYFLQKFGNHTLGSIRSDQVEEWFYDFTSDFAEATKSSIRSCLIAFFNAYRPENNPAASIPTFCDRPLRIHIPNQDDVRAALLAAQEMSKSDIDHDVRDALIFSFSVISGARTGEIHNLSVKEVVSALKVPITLGDNVIYTAFSNGKTGRSKIVFNEYHVPLIKRWLEVRPETQSRKLFVSVSNCNYGGQISLETMGRARISVCQKAEVEPFTYQDLRRLKATLVGRSHGLDAAAGVLGHSTSSGTKVVKEFYFDPDKNAVNLAVSDTFNNFLNPSSS